MKKPLIVSGIVIILLTVGLSGCVESASDKIIGKWTTDVGYMVFHTDNTGAYYISDEDSWTHFKWRIVDDYLHFELVEYPDINEVVPIKFIDYDTFQLSDGALHYRMD